MTSTFQNFSYPDFMEEFAKALRENKHGMRKGQIFYHTLNAMCPGMATALRHAEKSPFHNDNVSEALAWLWNNTPEYRESD